MSERKNNIQTISTEELAAKLKAGEKFEFWNVLTAEYYGNENIKGSRHVPLDTIGREIALRKLSKETEIVVYCAGPECPQSGAAAEKLITFGYANVKAYEGGLEEWEAPGLPLVQEDAPRAEKAVPAANSGGASCH